MKQGQQMKVIRKQIIKASGFFSVCLLLSACGSGGGDGEKIDSSITPPQSSVVLPSLLSTVSGTQVDARDVLLKLPTGYTSDDVALSLSVADGTQADITQIEKGLWKVIPKVSTLGEISLRLETKLAGNTQSQTLKATAYPDIDSTRQIISFGQSRWDEVAEGGELSLPMQIKQVKTTASPGASVRVHFSGNAWEWGEAILTETNSKLVSGVLYEDINNHDGDVSTDYFVLFSWFQSTGWEVPHDEKWYSLASLNFKRKVGESAAGSRFNFSVVDEPVGIESVLIATNVGAQ